MRENPAAGGSGAPRDFYGSGCPVDSSPSPAAQAPPHRVAVVDHARRCDIGYIIDRGEDGFEAVTTHDGTLGFYPTAATAARELWRHDRSSWTTLGEAAADALGRAV
jgi:hypothetical protein